MGKGGCGELASRYFIHEVVGLTSENLDGVLLCVADTGGQEGVGHASVATEHSEGGKPSPGEV